MKPRKVITVPEAENSATWPVVASPASLMVAVKPLASAIWEATVRFQISS